MKNTIITILLCMFINITNAQVVTYNAKAFYCFSVPIHLNPFLEFIENRETEEEGHKGSVDYIFDDTAKTVTVKSYSYNTTTVYKIISKDTSYKNVTKYYVCDGDFQFYFLISKQNEKLINLYCFWSEGLLNKGWQSVIN